MAVTSTMEVGIAALRRDLSQWLDRARSGHEVVVTDRGRPVARIVGADGRSRLQALEASGRIAPPTGPRAQPDPIATDAPVEIAAEIIAERDHAR